MASDDSDEDALAVFLMVTALEESKQVKKRKRCTLVQPRFQNRPTPGAYHALLQELQCSDQKSLHNFLRMDVESFAQLMQKVAPLITQQETSTLNFIMIVGLLGIKQKWKLEIPFNQHFNSPPQSTT